MTLSTKIDRKVKINRGLFALTHLVFVACAAMPQTDTHPAINQAPKTIRGWRLEQNHMGESIDIPVSGRVTVLDFWSTYCPPCIAAMPELERMWQGADKNQVAFIGVSVDEGDSVARKTMAETFAVQVTFPMVYDGKKAELQGAYKIGGTVPATFVIDKQGRVRFYFDGSDGDMERLEYAIAALAAE
jgi:thiol-disulfide isomerase/thioredoxin